jgi:hypothetical protein
VRKEVASDASGLELNESGDWEAHPQGAEPGFLIEFLIAGSGNEQV